MKSTHESDVEMSCAERHSRAEKSSGISRQASSSGQAPPPPEMEQPYERRFSVAERFVKLVISPSEAMKDAALAPDYLGPITIVVLEVIFLIVYLGLVLQRTSFTGEAAATVSAIWGTVVSIVVGVLAVVGSLVYVVFWLVKSYLVRTLSDSGSGWEFRTAASVTGYAYLADLIIVAVDALIVLLLMPPVVIATSLSRSELAAQLQSQIGWIRTFSIPLSLLSLVWKSYLGGLGSHHGTGGKCSVSKGCAVFLVLALIGWAISFLIRGF